MSDFKTQDSAPGALPGGDRFVDQRRGNEASQAFPLTGAKGTTEVNNDVPASLRSPNTKDSAGSIGGGDMSGMNAGHGVSITTKAVDQVSVVDGGRHKPAGSQGDVAGASLREAADNGGPRKPAGQWADSKRAAKGSGSFSHDHNDQSYPLVEDGD